MPPAVPTRNRVTELFEQYQFDLHQRTDRLFAGLLAFQWIAGILFAVHWRWLKRRDSGAAPSSDTRTTETTDTR
jgi:hypothetical protein